MYTTSTSIHVCIKGIMRCLRSRSSDHKDYAKCYQQDFRSHEIFWCPKNNVHDVTLKGLHKQRIVPLM